MLSRSDSVRGGVFPGWGVDFLRVLMSLGASKGLSRANLPLNLSPMRFQFVALLYLPRNKIS